MHPAFSVILLTTLIGVGQGLFVALYCAEYFGWVNTENRAFFVNGALASLLFLAAGLIASFFHLGRPERAWRAAAMWRTSWLSREVIVLPIAMLLILLYTAAQSAADTTGGQTPTTIVIGAIGLVAVLVLFLCTGMIYACIKFLQEWATPITVANFTLLGLVSGFVLATAHAGHYAPSAVKPLAVISCGLILLALPLKLFSFWRNNHITPKSTIQTAIGVRHNQINQQAVGFMGGSFNTREFFHKQSEWVLTTVMRSSIVLIFVVPLILFAIGITRQGAWGVFTGAFVIQYFGLLLERWHFFAQANHPQNLYYQVD